MREKLKVYELAKELAVDPQHLVDVVQRLGIDVKNSMNVLGSEEVRTVREHYRKNRPLAKAAAAAAVPAKNPVTEKRVGATVIRRRAKSTSEPEAPAPEFVETKEKTPAPVLEEVAVVESAPQEVVEEATEETVEFEAPAVEEVVEPVVAEEVSAPATVETKPLPVETKAAPVETKPVSAPVEERKPRRFYPSIIKKVEKEQHLGQIGPKIEKKEKPKEVPKPKPQPGASAPPATSASAATGLKRIKEVELATPEAAKDAGRKKASDGQNQVFKRSDYLKRELVHATKKKKAVVNRPALKTQITKPAEHKRIIEMAETISVADLAKEMGLKAANLIGKLMGMGVTATMNQGIDYDTAALLAHEYGYEVEHKIFKEEDYVPALDLSEEKLMPRPPVVTIMGHVDHGKTSLLDAIRKTQVAAGEAGGITQHIGAYQVEVPKGKITFVDTPGHEAFTAMRARGAKVTDVVVVVVSATDGVMPQTLESINHSKAANVPIIVAINKIDLPDGNPDRIKQTLSGHGLNPEEWGGDTIYVPVSAKTGKGIDQLLESILLQSEMLELKANYQTPARGTVVESRLDKNRGPIATILIQHGVLKSSDLAVCGTTYGKVRAMSDSLGKKVTEAGPSMPVEILGLPAVPVVGDDLFVVADEKTARELTTARADQQKAKVADSRPKLTLEEMMAVPGGEKELRVILKADVQGSSEALREALLKIPSEKAKVKLLHCGTGGITESDVMLAAASRAAILGFNIRPDVKAQKLAEQERVELRTYSIIYDLLDDVKKLMEGLLDKVVKERVIGRAEVRDVFVIPKVGAIAGSAVIDGKVVRGCYLRLLRDSRVVYEGKISSLRRFKEDVKEVAQGFECGIGLENFNDVKLGDQFEAFLKEESQGTL